MNTEKIGFPIYRMNEIHNMLCDIDVDKYADISKDECECFVLNDGDVIFNRTNSFEWVGRTGIYYKANNDEKRIFASYLVRFRPTENSIIPEYLCTYLNCKYGIWDIKRRARQSVNQTNVNPEEVKEIEIPLMSLRMQYKIKECFIIANNLRLKAKESYENATNFLNEILELDKLNLTEQTITQKKFSDVQKYKRFDAEYYHPLYDQLNNYILSYQTGYDKINTLFYIKDKNYIPERKSLYKYIELSNIGTDGSITGHTEAYGEDLPSRARRIVHAGDLIISSLEGSLQSCALIPPKYDGAICSTGFYVLSPKEINPETALLLFKSKLMQTLMKQVCSGSIMAAMNIDEFININMPKIDRQTQSILANLIQDGAQKRDESIRLLALTKTAIEAAIEQGENVGMKILIDKEAII